mgnify:FL=1
MIRVRQIKLSVLNDNKNSLEKKILQKLKVSKKELLSFQINKKSIDARDKKNIFYVYEVDVSLKNEQKISLNQDILLVEEVPYSFPKSTKKMHDRPLIVGSGPAGLFCAYLLAEAGYRPIIFERGDAMEERISTVQRFFDKNILDPESNIQFGEGGAGTFSDGKLNTLSKDHLGRQRKVFEIFVENGAPEEILYIHNPHIGTDILRHVIVNMRNKILQMGGEIHYRSCVTNIFHEKGKITGVEVNHKERIHSSIVVLAIGHSARDTFLMLHNQGVFMKPKNFAVGVRMEHKRQMIDEWQYGSFASKLGSASYKLTYQTGEGRSVYSFCMCPGGFVVNASSEEGMLAINGMSNYRRDEENSNSAIVVSVTPEDFGEKLFGGMEFQRELEKRAYQEGSGFIPVQLYKDFCTNTISTSFGEVIPNTKGATSFGNLRNVLPEYITNAILEAMPEFGKKIHGFDRGDTILLGVETRTSSPVVIVRDEDFSSSIHGLYPCGEGAGYAGGITTAGVDGIKVVEKIVLSL